MKKLPNPKNNIQEILLHLIQKGSVSIMDFPYLSSFRARVSDLKLKYMVILRRENKTSLNRFKNKYTYVVHYLDKSEFKKAKEIYLKMTE